MARTTKELRELQDEVVRLAERLESLATDVRDEVGDDASTTFDALRAKVSDHAARMRATARKKVHVADEYAHEQPWQVAGAALALGAVVGYLMSGHRLNGR